jgi:hypothetical protein
MSAQRLVSVVCYSQQVSRVNAAIEGPRRIFEMRTETKIDMMRVNWRFPASIRGEIVFTIAGRPRARPIPVLT